MLNVWDCVAEGLLMPITGLIMAILVGWVVPHCLDDEVTISSQFKTRKMFDFCIKWVGPIFMILIIYGQIREFW